MKSVQFIDAYDSKGEFFVMDPESFTSKLPTKKPVVVISVIGKFRIGKSYLINKLFFNDTVFEVSKESKPCTKGIHAAIHTTNKDFDILVIDTEGYEALLSQQLITNAPVQNISEHFDLLEDRIRAMLGIIISMSDIVLYVVKSNAIDRTDFTFIEYENIKLKNLYYPHLRDELKNLENSSSSNESLTYSALSKFTGPKLMLCHRYNSREVKQFDPIDVGITVKYLNFLITPDGKNNGSFSDVHVQKLDEQDSVKDFNDLKETIFNSYLKKVPVSMYPKNLSCWYQILSSMMIKICQNPPPFSSILRNFIRKEVGVCKNICVVCNERCENYAMHSQNQCFSYNKCTKSNKYSNTVIVHKNCPNAPTNGYSLLTKQSAYTPSSLRFGTLWKCEKCDNFEEYEYVQDGLFNTKENQILKENSMEIYFHCFNCNQDLWNPSKTDFQCQHSKQKCPAKPYFEIKDGSFQIISKL